MNYLEEACLYGKNHSDDQHTQVGVVLVAQNRRLVYAANCITPTLARLPERLERPRKYKYIEHAERAAIYKAASCGVPTAGATMYASWFACEDCARAIIAAGIAEVVGSAAIREATPARWLDSVQAGEDMLREAGVAIRWQATDFRLSLLMDGRLIRC